MTTNRCINFIEDIEREAEHKRRIDRVTRSEAVYAAACSEAIEHGITLSYSAGRYVIGDERVVVFFFPVHNVVMRSIAGRRRLEKLEDMPEMDVFDVVQNFIARRFHQ